MTMPTILFFWFFKNGTKRWLTPPSGAHDLRCTASIPPKAVYPPWLVSAGYFPAARHPHHQRQLGRSHHHACISMGLPHVRSIGCSEWLPSKLVCIRIAGRNLVLGVR